MSEQRPSKQRDWRAGCECNRSGLCFRCEAADEIERLWSVASECAKDLAHYRSEFQIVQASFGGDDCFEKTGFEISQKMGQLMLELVQLRKRAAHEPSAVITDAADMLTIHGGIQLAEGESIVKGIAALIEKFRALQDELARKPTHWEYRWYGSGDDRGSHVFQDGERIAYLGDQHHNAVSSLVYEHNKTVERATVPPSACCASTLQIAADMGQENLRVMDERDRYKQALYQANGRLMQLGQDPVKLEYPTETKGIAP